MQNLVIGIALALGIAFIARGFLDRPDDAGTPPTDAATTAAAREAEPAQSPEIAPQTEDEMTTDANQKITKTDAEWRAQLTDEEYRITRQAGTERAFTGKYWNTKTKGTYVCKCCDTPLFTSDAKFDSGCGWPSFFEATEDFRISEHKDTSYGMVRTEVRCARCDAHLGHVFPDAPQTPTGMRYCINSAAIKLIEDEIVDPMANDKPKSKDAKDSSGK